MQNINKRTQYANRKNRPAAPSKSGSEMRKRKKLPCGAVKKWVGNAKKEETAP
jgi:hypothetical protein